MRKLVWAAFVVAACNDAPDLANPCASRGITVESRFPHGSPDGHADVPGARAAGQARAGRIRDVAWIRQSDDAKQKVRVGDFLLANDKVALYIEAEGPSDGYMPFGGEILAIESVGDDGLPRGKSQYSETLFGLSHQAIDPDKVTVLADGSDGKAAIVRVSGRFRSIPFLETFAAFLPDEYDFPAALDYVLEPGSEKVTLRLSMMNIRNENVDLSTNQNFGFFHSMRNRWFAEGSGYGDLSGKYPWIGWDGGESAFIVRAKGQP